MRLIRAILAIGIAALLGGCARQPEIGTWESERRAPVQFRITFRPDNTFTALAFLLDDSNLVMRFDGTYERVASSLLLQNEAIMIVSGEEYAAAVVSKHLIASTADRDRGKIRLLDGKHAEMRVRDDMFELTRVEGADIAPKPTDAERAFFKTALAADTTRVVHYQIAPMPGIGVPDSSQYDGSAAPAPGASVTGNPDPQAQSATGGIEEEPPTQPAAAPPSEPPQEPNQESTQETPPPEQSGEGSTPPEQSPP